MIFHITTADHWRASQEGGAHTDPSLEAEGFIHCSRSEQVVATANRFYQGQRGLVVLVIDPERLRAELKVEDSYGHGSFPHIYGTVNLQAVVDTFDLIPDPDGTFSAIHGIEDYA